MNLLHLLQNKTVKKLSKEELIQDYVFDKEFAKNMMRSYWEAKNSHSLQDFLCDYLIDESSKEGQKLVDEKVDEITSLVNLMEIDADLAEYFCIALEIALKEKLLSEQAIESYTRMQEINKRSNVRYDLHGFVKIDGVLYYITDEIAYNLSDLPFQCVVVSSVCSFLKNDDNTTNRVWEKALHFLLDARFYKELVHLLKKEGLMQKNREGMLLNFLQVLPNKQNLNRIDNSAEMYNFYILFAFLQLIKIDDQKAHELAQNCVDTMSLQGIIDYLSVLVKLEIGNADV